MNEEGIEQVISVGQIIQEQIDSLFIYLARPAVQRQLLVIALIIFLVWISPSLVRLLRRRLRPEGAIGKDRSNSFRRLFWLYTLLPPLVGLILVQGAIWLFTTLDAPHGLLVNSRFLFLLWLAYRAILLFLTGRYGDAVRPYSRWIITPIFAAIVVIQITDSFVALSLLGQIPLLTVGEAVVSLSNVIFAVILIYLFVILAWISEQLLNRNLPNRLNMELGVTQSVSTLARYAIIGFGFLVALYALGLDLTSLAIVAGGLSVGIGIGLQDITANFISGLLLLSEQALRPGDVIELDGRVNEVQKVSIRTTLVRNRDNVEVIIPNATLTTTQVTTLTKTDRLVRIRLPIGVSYDSDPREVRRIAEETASNHNLIQEDPKPTLLFNGYGDSSLNFELAVWTDSPAQRPFIKSDLYYMLWSAFGKNGIEIPFPQRDLNLRRGWEKVVSKTGQESSSLSAPG